MISITTNRENTSLKSDGTVDLLADWLKQVILEFKAIISDIGITQKKYVINKCDSVVYKCCIEFLKIKKRETLKTLAIKK